MIALSKDPARRSGCLLGNFAQVERLARGGVGLMITGMTFVNPLGKGQPLQHGAHGYLISSFLSPITNRRRDEWGGDAERRFRFPAAVYAAVRNAVGQDFPVLYKRKNRRTVLVMQSLHG